MFDGLTQLTGASPRRSERCNASTRAFTPCGTSTQTNVRMPPPACPPAEFVRLIVALIVNRAVVLHEAGLRIQALAAFRADGALVVAVQQQPPRLDVVAQAEVEHFFLQVALQARV